MGFVLKGKNFKRVTSFLNVKSISSASFCFQINYFVKDRFILFVQLL